MPPEPPIWILQPLSAVPILSLSPLPHIALTPGSFISCSKTQGAHYYNQFSYFCELELLLKALYF